MCDKPNRKPIFAASHLKSMLSTAVSSIPAYHPLVPQYGAGKEGDRLFCGDYNAKSYLCGRWIGFGCSVLRKRSKSKSDGLVQ